MSKVGADPCGGPEQASEIGRFDAGRKAGVNASRCEVLFGNHAEDGTYTQVELVRCDFEGDRRVNERVLILTRQSLGGSRDVLAEIDAAGKLTSDIPEEKVAQIVGETVIAGSAGLRKAIVGDG